MIKIRLFALLLIFAFAAMVYYNWHQLKTGGSYSMKLATFGPVGILGGLFLLVLPSKAGKPKTIADKLIVILIFVIGLGLGLLNWYLMDPGFFGR